MSTQLIEQEVSQFTKLENEIIIRNDEDCNRANIVLKNIKEMMKKVKDTFSPIIAKAHAAHKEAKAQQDKYLTPLENCEKAFKNRIAGYLEDQERIRQKLQAELQEKARKEAEKLEQKAKEAEQKGDEAKAEELREKATMKQALIPEVPQAQKPDGLSVRKVWKAEVVDISKVPLEFLTVNLSAVEKVLNATNGKEIAGIKARQESIVSSRATKDWSD